MSTLVLMIAIQALFGAYAGAGQFVHSNMYSKVSMVQGEGSNYIEAEADAMSAIPLQSGKALFKKDPGNSPYEECTLSPPANPKEAFTRASDQVICDPSIAGNLLRITIPVIAVSANLSSQDCSDPRHQPGYLLVSSDHDAALIQKVSESLDRSEAFKVLEVVDHVEALDGTVHSFDGLALKVNLGTTAGEREAALANLKKIAGIDIACMSAGSFKNGRYIGI